MRALVDEFAETGDDSLRLIIDEYIHASYKVQRTPNPSGTFWEGGLGEPK